MGGYDLLFRPCFRSGAVAPGRARLRGQSKPGVRASLTTPGYRGRRVDMIRPSGAPSEAGTRVTPTDSRNPFLDLPILPVAIILGLALRVAAAIVVPNQQFPDAIGYRAAGLSLWTTGRISEPLFMPLYPVLVGLTGPGFGQLALDVALSTVMIWLGHRLTLAT